MAKASDNVFPKLIVASGSAPATPSAGQGKIYEKSSDKKLYFKNEDGTEYDLTTTSGGGGGSGLLAAVGYNPGTLQTITTTSTTPVDVDATNLAVTFTAPTSGIVMVALSGFTKNGNTDKANLWYLRNGSTTVASRYAINNFYPITVTVFLKVSGLTSGNSYTYKWAHSAESGSTAYLQYGGTVGDAAMLVWGV